MPANLKTVSIGAFGNCKFTGIEISEGVEVIAERAFTECCFEGDIIIPSTVTSVGEEAFAGIQNIDHMMQLM